MGAPGQQGRRPPRRGGCLLLLLPLCPPRGGASLPTPAPLPSQSRPGSRQHRSLRKPPEGGGARLGCRHVAGAGPGRSREEGAAAPPCLRFPGLRRERELRVPGTGRARLGSGSAARRSGPHVTGGGAACSRHRPGGGRRRRAPAAGLRAPPAGAGPERGLRLAGRVRAAGGGC